MWCGEDPIDLIWRHGAGIQKKNHCTRNVLLQLLTTVSFRLQRPSATINHAEWHSDFSESWSTNVTEVLSWSEFLQIVKIKTVLSFRCFVHLSISPLPFCVVFVSLRALLPESNVRMKRESLTSQWNEQQQKECWSRRHLAPICNKTLLSISRKAKQSKVRNWRKP